MRLPRSAKPPGGGEPSARAKPRRTGPAPKAKPLTPPGPSFEALAADLRARLRRFVSGRHGRGVRPALVVGVAGLAVIGWAATGFYLVEPGQQALVYRFGAPVGRTGPGLDYHLPAPVEAARIVSTAKVQTLEVGGDGDDAHRFGPTPTRDGDLLDVDLLVQWRVADPGRYLSASDDPEGLLRADAEGALGQAVGGMTLQQVLTRRAAIEAQVGSALRSDAGRLGIAVASVQVKRISPPPAVTPAVQDLAAARREAGDADPAAASYRDHVLADARGDAAKVAQQADGYRQQVVAEAKGEADRFTDMDAAYRRAPDLTRRRLYLETMQQVLTHARKVVIALPKGSKTSVVLPPDLFPHQKTAEPAPTPPTTTPDAGPPAGDAPR